MFDVHSGNKNENMFFQCKRTFCIFLLVQCILTTFSSSVISKPSTKMLLDMKILGLAVSPGKCSMIKINPTVGSIDQFIVPWINDSSLCHTNKSIHVATTSLYGGQVLVMRKDCQSHIIDFHESRVTEVEVPVKVQNSNSRECFTAVGLLYTYMRHKHRSFFIQYTLVRLRRNTWKWQSEWQFDDQFLYALHPENDSITPLMNMLGTNKEHKLLFDLGNRIFYNCSTNKCSNMETAEFSAADVHNSIPSRVQLFEFGDTIYTIYHSINDYGRPVLNGRDIRNSSNAFRKPSPDDLDFKLFAVNISNRDSKQAFLCIPNSSRAKLDKTESKESNHEEVILFILLMVLIIGSCIIVALLVIVYIQRSKLAKIQNSKVCSCNSDATTHDSQLQRSPNVLPLANDIQDRFNDSSSKSMEAPHEETHERSAALINPHITPQSTSMKSCSDVTQSLSSADLSPDSSTVKSIGQHLKKWNDLKIPPARPHPETTTLQTISTKIPPGPQECMNPRGEKTTSKDRNHPTLGHWPIQFMRRVLRAKRRSETPVI